MNNDNQALKNRRNALLSTGPKTVAGRSKSSKNALAHGLYAAALVPALGESPAALAELGTAVREVLRPEGVLEERLCDRVALLLLRFDRVSRFEAAVAVRDAAAVASPAPDPDTISGAGADICLPPPPEAPAVFRLAYARARIAGWSSVRNAFRPAASALDGHSEPGVTISGQHARRVMFAVGEVFGWERDEALARWTAAAGATDDSIPGAKFVSTVRELAVTADREPDGAVRAVRARMIERAAEYDAPIAEQEAVAAHLAAEMRAARERAAAAVVYADAKAIDTVVRLEAHLTRQMGLSLDLLDRLRGARSGEDRAGLGGILRELGAGTSLVVG